jgi:hypothetical protein
MMAAESDVQGYKLIFKAMGYNWLGDLKFTTHSNDNNSSNKHAIHQKPFWCCTNGFRIVRGKASGCCELHYVYVRACELCALCFLMCTHPVMQAM